MKHDQLQNKRVLILFPHLVIPGGALIYTLRLAEQLQQRGAEVAILTLRHEPRQIQISAAIEVIAHPHGPLTSSLSFWLSWPVWQHWIVRKIRNWNPDLLISQVFPSNWWGWLAKRVLPQIPLLWVCHEPSAFIHSEIWIRVLQPVWKSRLALSLRPFLAHADRRLSKYGDAVVANSRFTAEQVKRVYDLKVAAIANPGVILDDFPGRRAARSNLLLTVAHLSGFKRIDFLLQVFAGILERQPHLRLAIVGDGEKMTALKQFATTLQIAGQVDFHGRLHHSEIVRLYTGAALYMHGGVEEAFGMALIEALAGGCPVLAHASGGPLEIVTPDTGRLMPNLDPMAWSKAAIALLEQDDAQTALLCRKRAADFSWKQTGDRIASVCHQLITLFNSKTNP
ncbi:MAG TPA: glycosyltransferase family 1 protein [Proteobacteria bacterium]|nr:glycosyltransferase family 1 protein [Pseudomonadota bacterium]